MPSSLLPLLLCWICALWQLHLEHQCLIVEIEPTAVLVRILSAIEKSYAFISLLQEPQEEKVRQSYRSA